MSCFSRLSRKGVRGILISTRGNDMKRIWTSGARKVASLLALTLALTARAGVPVDPNLVALFADTHATADAKRTNQRAGVERCVREILALNPRPANLLILGDLSFDHGVTNDYQTLRDLLSPLAKTGVRWHACFGNHDRRASFFAVFPEQRAAHPPVPERHVSRVETPYADFILLDSCLEGPVNGGLDDAQRAWLEKTVAANRKPLFLCAHHGIGETGVAGLMVSNALCKAYLFGHHHNAAHREEKGVRTFCLPSTGHWGDIGFMLMRLTPEEARLTLRQHDYYTRPPTRPEDVNPEWRERTIRKNGLEWRVPLATAGGFDTLFNGTDFQGWRRPQGDNNHWRILDGVIDYDARSEAKGDKNLWSERSLRDFELHLEWRIKETPYVNPHARRILPDGSEAAGPDGKPLGLAIPDSDSGVYLRGSGKHQVNIWCWPVGSGEMYGVRRDSAMPPEVRAGVTPRVCADRPVGEWNRFEITVRGNTVRVLLNGQAVLPGVTIPGLPAEGPIALQHHGSLRDGKWVSPPSLVQFRNIFVREL